MRDGGRWLAVALALVLFAAYGIVLTRGPFGINDDYQYLYRTWAGTFHPAGNELMGMGRPLNAWGVQLAYAPCAGQVARLAWLRALTLVGLGVFAWLLFRVLASLRYGQGFAATVAVLVVLTPACGVFAAYASVVTVPLALCCALGGGWLLVRPQRGGWRDFAGGVLILLACANWQAAVPLATFPALADAWVRVGEERRAQTFPWWRPWLIGAVAVACYVLLCALIAHFGAVSRDGAARLAVVKDPAAKARLLAGLLRSGVSSWARLQVGPWEWTVGVFTTVACLLALPVRRNGQWQGGAIAARAGLAVLLVLISVGPLLAAREDNGAFRSLVCLYVAVTFLGVSGARRALLSVPVWARSLAAVLAVIASVGAARYHVWHGLVEPNRREYVGVRDEARRLFTDGLPPRVVYLVPPFVPPTDRMTPAWEFGLTSSAFWWAARPFVLLVLADTQPGRMIPEDVQVSFREASNPGVPVLQSLPAVLHDPGNWRDDPRWGRVRAFRDGWLYSPWFGYLNVAQFPYVHHHLLGGLLFSSQPSDGNNLWFYRADTGHFRTGPGEYPHLLLAATGHWATPSDTPPSQVQLFDDLTHERLPYVP